MARKAAGLVELMRCSKCGLEIMPDGNVPSFDALTGLQTCDVCRAEQRWAAVHGPMRWLKVPDSTVRPS